MRGDALSNKYFDFIVLHKHSVASVEKLNFTDFITGIYCNQKFYSSIFIFTIRLYGLQMKTKLKWLRQN